MNQTCSVFPCIKGTFVPLGGKSCSEWQRECFAKRDKTLRLRDRETIYKECITDCQHMFSPSYRGTNRMRVEKRCYDKCDKNLRQE